jgi:hypothetical protein
MNINQVMSATNWAVGSVTWNDGNDYHDMDDTDISSAHSNGYVQDWKYLFKDGYSSLDVSVMPIKVVVSGSGTSKGKLYGLFIGVDLKNEENIDGKADAKAVYNRFKEIDLPFEKKLESPIIVKPDSSTDDLYDINFKIFSYLESIPDITSNDYFVFYFSGHGQFLQNDDETPVMVEKWLWDIENNGDEVLTLGKDNTSDEVVYVSDDELTSWLSNEKFKEVSKLVLLWGLWTLAFEECISQPLNIEELSYCIAQK